MVWIMTKIKVTKRQFKLLLDNMHWLKHGLTLHSKAKLLKQILN